MHKFSRLGPSESASFVEKKSKSPSSSSEISAISKISHEELDDIEEKEPVQLIGYETSQSDNQSSDKINLCQNQLTSSNDEDS